MFIGREKQLKFLEERYKKGKFEFIVIRGRRRIGKSTLIKEFCKNKEDVILYLAQERNRADSLLLFSKVINQYLKNNATYQDFQDLFQDIFERSEKKRIILVIDEFPYLANSDKSIMSILQNLIDEYKEKSKLYLIICGSSISFMEDEVLAYKAPLYGRCTGQMKIEQLYYSDMKKFFKNYSNEQKITLYSIFGGVPAYLETINQKETIEKNIINNLMEMNSFLYEEPDTLLKEELREPATYNSIIGSIANGASKINEISTKIGMEKDKVSVYLQKLIYLQIVKKENPITDKVNSKKSIYSLSDNLFKFWYRFIANNKVLIEFNDNKEQVYNELIKPNLNDYIGHIFEDICKDYILLHINTDKIPFILNQIGRWWGTNSITKTEEEIDIVSFTNDNKKAFFVECKWKNEKVGINVLKDLIRKSELLPQFENKFYGIFSKSGFTKELKEYAEKNNIYLYDLDDLYK